MAGKERHTSGRKRSAPNPDFKRIKAKVGRRAPNAANQTDTSFRATSLQCRAQSIVQSSSVRDNDASSLHDDLRLVSSSRGNSIQDLLSKIQHPAVAVRISAVKGLKDVMVRSLSMSSFSASATTSASQLESVNPWLQAHLSLLISSTFKCCCVDDEDDVRTLAIATLESILLQLGDKQQTEVLLQPLSPILMALLQTSLNSLDRNTRRDGAVIVELLSLRAPGIIGPVVEKLLPPFVRLLMERASIRAPDQKQSKNSGSAKRRGGDIFLLQSFLAFLRTREVNQRGYSDDSPHHHYGLMAPAPPSSMGSLIIASPHDASSSRVPRQRIRYIRRLEDLLPAPALHGGDSESPTEEPSGARGLGQPDLATTGHAQLQSLDVIASLLEQLRDILLECMQSVRHVNAQSVALPDDQLERLSLVTQAVQVLVTSYVGANPKTDHQLSSSSSLVVNTGSTKATVPVAQSRYAKVSSLLTKAMLEVLPIHTESRLVGASLKLSPALVNSTLCSAVLSIVASWSTLTASDRGGLPWKERPRSMEAIVRYIQSAMSELPVSPTDHFTDADSSNGNALVQVVRMLVQNQSNLFPSEDDRLDLAQLFQEFCAAFFPPDQPSSRAWARSSCCRQAARLVHTVLQFYRYDTSVISLHLSADMSVQVCQQFPRFLVAWDVDYPSDTALVLTLLLELSRRQNLETLLPNLKCDDFLSLLQPAKSNDGKILRSRRRNDAVIPVEGFPEPLQRLLLAVLIKVSSLSEATVMALANLCARCHCHIPGSISCGVACLIQESVHRLRKTLPMQLYVTFILEASGVLHTRSGDSHEPSNDEAEATGDDSKSWTESSFAVDASTQSTLRLLVECGSPVKVLTMTRPFLLTCWKKDTTEGVAVSQGYGNALLRCRTAVAIVALLSLHHSAGDSNASAEPSLQSLLPADYQDELVNGCVSLLQLASLKIRRQDESLSMSNSTLSVLLQPLVVLLQHDPELLPRLFRHVLQSLRSQRTSSSRDDATNALDGLLWLFHVESLQSVMTLAAKDMLQDVESETTSCYSPQSANAANTDRKNQGDGDADADDDARIDVTLSTHAGDGRPLQWNRIVAVLRTHATPSDDTASSDLPASSN